MDDTTQPSEKGKGKRIERTGSGHHTAISDRVTDHGYLGMMSGATVRVYIVLQRHRNKATNAAMVSIATITQEAAVSARAVGIAITELTALGLLESKRRFRKSTVHTLLEPPEKPPTFSMIAVSSPKAERLVTAWSTPEGAARLRKPEPKSEGGEK